MEHQAHISDKSDISPVTRIIIALVVVAGIAATGVYVVYESGLWSPQVQHEAP